VNANRAIADCRETANVEFVRSLREYDFPRVLRATAILWAQLLAAWAVALWGPAWAIIPAAIVILVCQQAMSLWVHEGSHNTVLAAKRVNDLYIDALFGTPIGMNVRTYRTNHLTHHAHLGTREDLDRWTYAFPLRTWRAAREFLLLASGWYGLKVAFRKYGAAIVVGRSKLDEPAQLDRLAMSAAWNLALLLVCWAAGRWWLYPLLWLYPMLSFTVLLNVFRSTAEHQPAHYAGAVDQLADAPAVRTTTPPFWQKWAFYQSNFNYHLEHHAFPYVPSFNLPQLHRHLVAAGFYERHPECLQRSAFAAFARAG
jgi:fatty acid desaturase